METEGRFSKKAPAGFISLQSGYVGGLKTFSSLKTDRTATSRVSVPYIHLIVRKGFLSAARVALTCAACSSCPPPPCQPINCSPYFLCPKGKSGTQNRKLEVRNSPLTCSAHRSTHSLAQVELPTGRETNSKQCEESVRAVGVHVSSQRLSMVPFSLFTF